MMRKYRWKLPHALQAAIAFNRDPQKPKQSACDNALCLCPSLPDMEFLPATLEPSLGKVQLAGK
ncbi:MAG: hypothetical protein ACREU8_02560 [Gammaproteobacteria bacterium]